jgi:membrane protein
MLSFKVWHFGMGRTKGWGEECMRSAWKIIKGTVSEFSEDNVLRLSAALAYYSIFSLGPLLVIMVGVAGFVLGDSSVQSQVQEQLQGFLGPKSAGVVESMMHSQSKSGGLWTTIIGIVTLLLGASGVFGQLQDALNTIWEVKAKPGIGIWGFLRHRFLSFGMILVIGFLLLISMVISTVLSGMMGKLGSFLPMSEVVAHVVNFTVSFLVIALLFALMFKALPDVKIGWRDVWAGAFFTAFLFTVGKFLLGLYLGRASTTSSYGAAGAVVLILLWVYYASIIIFLGAEFTQVYAKTLGHKVEPTEYAVLVTEGEREQQGMPRQDPAKGSKDRQQPARPGAALKPVKPVKPVKPASPPQPAAAFAKTGAPTGSHQGSLAAQGPAPFRPIQQHPWRFASMALSAGVAFGAFYKMGVLKAWRRMHKVTS